MFNTISLTNSSSGRNSVFGFCSSTNYKTIDNRNYELDIKQKEHLN